MALIESPQGGSPKVLTLGGGVSAIFVGCRWWRLRGLRLGRGDRVGGVVGPGPRSMDRVGVIEPEPAFLAVPDGEHACGQVGAGRGSVLTACGGLGRSPPVSMLTVLTSGPSAPVSPARMMAQPAQLRLFHTDHGLVLPSLTPTPWSSPWPTTKTPPRPDPTGAEPASAR